MAPPRGMATVRTSMAIAGGSGESLGLIHERERGVNVTFTFNGGKNRQPQIVDCIVPLPWRIVRREK